MVDIEKAMERFNNEHGGLEVVVLPNDEYDLYHLSLEQKYPHVRFECDDIDGRILVQKNPN